MYSERHDKGIKHCIRKTQRDQKWGQERRGEKGNNETSRRKREERRKGEERGETEEEEEAGVTAVTFRYTTANGRNESHINTSDCQQLGSFSKGRMGGMT